MRASIKFAMLPITTFASSEQCTSRDLHSSCLLLKEHKGLEFSQLNKQPSIQMPQLTFLFANLLQQGCLKPSGRSKLGRVILDVYENGMMEDLTSRIQRTGGGIEEE